MENRDGSFRHPEAGGIYSLILKVSARLRFNFCARLRMVKMCVNVERE